MGIFDKFKKRKLEVDTQIKEKEDKSILEKYNEVKIIISSKATADVYFNDKVVRIQGELGIDGFLASPKSMKWMKPNYLRDKALTISEQQEIINIVNAYYREKKDKIYFEDDNPKYERKN